MRILAFLGALAIVIGVLAGGYFLGGFYSVAASASDARARRLGLDTRANRIDRSPRWWAATFCAR